MSNKPAVPAVWVDEAEAQFILRVYDCPLKHSETMAQINQIKLKREKFLEGDGGLFFEPISWP